MKRFVALTLIVLVSLPWAAFPAARATACAMPGAKAVEACTYCAPANAANSGQETLQAGCCRFQPTPESAPAQAGSVSLSPKPLHSLDATAIVPGVPAIVLPSALDARALLARSGPPPPVSPTRTTHLLL